MRDQTMNKAIFLDRDGVLNKAIVREGKSYPPDTIEAFHLIDGVKGACNALKAAGYLLIVVTNQPDVATGKQTMAKVQEMHDRLGKMLPLDDIFACFHVDAEGCACRKPKPGMLLEAARKHEIDLTSSFMVGDRWRDIEAGNSAGCASIFIDYGYDEKRPEHCAETVFDLREASKYILEIPR